MNRNRTAIEMKMDLQMQFGRESGEFLAQLEQDHLNLRIARRLYCSLFTSNQETTSLLELTGGTLFSVIRIEMRTAIILRISRLCDPGKQRNNNNLSLRGLLDLSPFSDDPTLRNIWDDIDIKSQKIRKERSKIHAHRDYNLAVGKDEFDTVLEDDISETIALLRDFFQRISEAHQDTTTIFDPLLNKPDEKTFLHILHLGHKLWKDTLENGEIEDIERLTPPDWIEEFNRHADAGNLRGHTRQI